MMLKKLFLFIYACSYVTVSAQPVAKGYKKADVNDLVLIYQGGAHRLDWTAQELEPYVVHQDIKGEKDWFFDGFLFLDFKDGKGRCYASRYENQGARKQEWEWLMDRVFEKDKALDALNKTIEKHIETLGVPSFKHKVVLCVPEPIPQQKDWGELKGKSLDFSCESDKLDACIWYIDKVTQRFNEQNFKHLELAGFYWISEDVATSKKLTVPIGDYIRKQNHKFYWIPYWNAMGFSDWKELGFDVAYLQPNHFFNKRIHKNRIEDACKLAYAFNMGLEMEFDNRALVDHENSFRDRMIDYIDQFEKNDVFDQSAIAYYTGGSAIISLSTSQNKKDRELLDRLAKLVQDRREDQTLKKKDFWNNADKYLKIDAKTNNWELSTGAIDTKEIFETTRGEFEIQAKIIASAKSDKVAIRLLPCDENKANEVTVMRYSGEKPNVIEGGIITKGLNKEKGTEKRTSLQIDKELKSTTLTINCKWDKHSIKLFANNVLFFVYDDYLLDRSASNLLDYWPFDKAFYLEISAESEDSTPVIKIENLVFKEV